MCMISHAVAVKIFGRHVHSDHGEISSSLDRLMGPDFSGYLKHRDAHRKILESLKFEHLSIQAEDGIKLAGYYYANPLSSKRTAVLVHGHSSNGFEGYAAVGLKYIDHGYNILLVDNRACGNSEGKWCTFGILERSDTLKWVEYLVQRDPDCSIVLHGTSLGGACVCMMMDLNLPSQVKAAVSDCAFSNIRKQLEYMIRVTAHIPPGLILPEVLAWFHHWTDLSVDSCSPLESVRQSRIPMMFIHGTLDHYVPMENAKVLYEACPARKQLLLIEGAGHAASHYIGKETYELELFQFLNQTLKGEQ